MALGGVGVALISETIDWPVMLYGCCLGLYGCL